MLGSSCAGFGCLYLNGKLEFSLPISHVLHVSWFYWLMQFCLTWYNKQVLFLYFFAAQWNEWYSPGKPGVCKGMSISSLLDLVPSCYLVFLTSCLSLQGRGTFPCDISVLEIHQDLDWNPKVSTLNVWPLYICDDGAVVFYRYIGNYIEICLKSLSCIFLYTFFI